MGSYSGWLLQGRKKVRISTEAIELIYMAQNVTSFVMNGTSVRLRDFKLKKVTGLQAYLNGLKEYRLSFKYAFEQNELLAYLHVTGEWKDGAFALHTSIFTNAEGNRRIVRIRCEEDKEKLIVAEFVQTQRPDATMSPSPKQSARVRVVQAAGGRWEFRQRLAAVTKRFSAEKNKDEAA